MKTISRTAFTAVFTAALSFPLLVAAQAPAQAASDAGPKPALKVQLVPAQTQQGSVTVAANGNLAAWQEVSVGAEVGGLRLVRVEAQVGDRVKRGQLLAQFATETLEAELAAARAALQEATVAAQEAQRQAARLQSVAGTDAVSPQQVEQGQTAAAAALARQAALQAQVRGGELRLSYARLVAPDDGVIVSREAVPGSLTAPGQELFRLIRQGRLEWRAEVPATELAALKPGQSVRVMPAGGAALEGRVRIVAPKVDPQTRNALVYVDLPQPGTARAGMFARGEFQIEQRAMLTLPQTAVLLRNGFAYVFKVDKEQRARQTKVELGRRQGEGVEIRSGLQAGDAVVAQGVGFLAEGDRVQVVPAGKTAK